MKLTYRIFTDPMYDAERDAEFDPLDVVTTKHLQVSLLMRGRFWVTDVTLKDGTFYRLEGRVGDAIETERRKAREAAAHSSS